MPRRIRAAGRAPGSGGSVARWTCAIAWRPGSCSTVVWPPSSSAAAPTCPTTCGRPGCCSRSRRGSVTAHAAFFAAGADVAITASYQVSYDGFARHGPRPRRDRAPADVVGPPGARRRRRGRRRPPGRGLGRAVRRVPGRRRPSTSATTGRTAAELAELAPPAARGPLVADPDLLAVETIPSVVEAEALVAVLAEVPEASAWMAFSCRDGDRISDGTPIADAAAVAASSPQVVAVGVNCTPPGFLPSLLASAAGAGLPLVAYPNVGSRWDATARAWRVGRPSARPRPPARSRGERPGATVDRRLLRRHARRHRRDRGAA